MKRFVTRSAWKQARKSKIRSEQLVEASNKINDALVDAKLGAHLYKQHVGRKGDYRAILFHAKDQRSVVIHIFRKNVQPNISGKELKTLRDFADVLNGLSDEAYLKAARERGWEDISDEDPEEDVQNRPPPIDP